MRFVREFERSIARVGGRGDFRVVHYSLQSNHAHLIVEAAHGTALSRGMTAVGSRLARAVHRVFRRSGPVLAERYHVRALKTPREVRNVLRYVLLNGRKHASQPGRGGESLGPASPARWFDGWVRAVPIDVRWARLAVRSPLARARTWLLAVGWRRHGLLDPGDVPGTG